ncbi:MAG: hypothetical protein WBP03_04590 [Candidatus Saccharimonadales bacterium]
MLRKQLVPVKGGEIKGEYPPLNTWEAGAVAVRFGVRHKGKNNADWVANRMYPGLTQEMATRAAAELARQEATTTTGAIATGLQYDEYAKTVSAMQSLALQTTAKPAERVNPPAAAAPREAGGSREDYLRALEAPAPTQSAETPAESGAVVSLDEARARVLAARLAAQTGTQAPTHQEGPDTTQLTPDMPRAAGF